MKHRFLILLLTVCIAMVGCNSTSEKNISQDNAADQDSVAAESATAEDAGNTYTDEEKKELVSQTTQLDLDSLFSTLSKNEAKAKTDYDQKMYQVKVTAMNIKSDHFEYAYTYDGGIKSILVFMPTEDLAKLINDDKIIVLGKLEISGSMVSLKNAFVVDSNIVEQQSLSDGDVKEIIDNYYPIGDDGNVSWKTGSSPILIENRLTFEQLDSNNFYDIVKDDTWTGRHYVTPDSVRTINFTSDSTADVSTDGGDIYEWKYAFSGNNLKFPDSASDFYEVRKAADNLIVFYANTVDYVPYWIIYK